MHNRECSELLYQEIYWVVHKNKPPDFVTS